MLAKRRQFQVRESRKRYFKTIDMLFPVSLFSQNCGEVCTLSTAGPNAPVKLDEHSIGSTLNAP